MCLEFVQLGLSPVEICLSPVDDLLHVLQIVLFVLQFPSLLLHYVTSFLIASDVHDLFPNQTVNWSFCLHQNIRDCDGLESQCLDFFDQLFLLFLDLPPLVLEQYHVLLEIIHSGSILLVEG